MERETFKIRQEGEKWGKVKTENEESEIKIWQLNRLDILYSGSVRIRDREVLNTRDPKNMAAVLVQHFPLSQGLWNKKWNAGRTCCHSHSFQTYVSYLIVSPCSVWNKNYSIFTTSLIQWLGPSAHWDKDLLHSYEDSAVHFKFKEPNVRAIWVFSGLSSLHVVVITFKSLSLVLCDFAEQAATEP